MADTTVNGSKKDLRVINSLFGSYIFKDVNVLNHPVDEQFEHLYNGMAIYLQGGTKVPNAAAIIGPDFVKQSIDYFKTNAKGDGSNSKIVGDQYIENLTILPNHFNQRGDSRSSYIVWMSLLDVLNSIEQSLDIKIHKGTAYYFAGGNAIETNDFESGMIMMHLALQEDKRNNPQWKIWPAYSFMSIDPDNVSQYHKDLVSSMAELIKDKLAQDANSYHKTRSGAITYSELRKKFLLNEKGLTSSARYYFVYSPLCEIKR